MGVKIVGTLGRSSHSRRRALVRATVAMSVAAGLFLQSPKPTLGRALPGLYSPIILQHERAELERYVFKLKGSSIEPAVIGAAREVVGKMTIAFPLSGEYGDPFDFSESGSVVYLPILSLVFLRDLVKAYFLAAGSLGQHRDCGTSVLLYVNLLKYRQSESLPGGRYLNPIEFFAVPEVSTLAKISPELDPATRAFNTILLFLVAHETGHVVRGHKGFGSIAKEVEADDFAFDILAYNKTDPTDVFLFFLLSSMWVPTEAELTQMGYLPNHPLNGDRMKTLGTRLVEHPERYYPGLNSLDSRIQSEQSLGFNLIRLGDTLNDTARREQLRDVALRTDPFALGRCERP